MGDRVTLAELVHPARAVDAELGLERARLVIDAGVEHAGVVAGLVTSNLLLALEQRDAQSRLAIQQLVRECQPDDATTDDRKIALLDARGGHQAVWPASTGTTAAVINDDSSLAKNTTASAISRGFAKRF